MRMVMVMTIGKYVLRYIGSIYISGQPMDRKLNDKQCVTRRINQDANITRYRRYILHEANRISKLLFKLDKK